MHIPREYRPFTSNPTSNPTKSTRVISLPPSYRSFIFLPFAFLLLLFLSLKWEFNRLTFRFMYQFQFIQISTRDFHLFKNPPKKKLTSGRGKIGKVSQFIHKSPRGYI